MHLLHLGVSRVLKEATSVRLRSTTLNNDCYRSVKRSERTFASLCTAINGKVNKVFGEVTRQTEGVPLPLYVRKSEGRTGLNGVFMDNGLGSMLEAADIKTGYYFSFRSLFDRSHMW